MLLRNQPVMLTGDADVLRSSIASSSGGSVCEGFVDDDALHLAIIAEAGRRRAGKRKCSSRHQASDRWRRVGLRAKPSVSTSVKLVLLTTE